MATKTITVDVDSNAVRVLETRGNRVHRWATAPLESGVVSEGVVRDAEALGNELKRLMGDNGISGRAVTLSIGGLYSVCRLLDLRPQTGLTLEQAIEDAVPGDAMRIQYQLLESDGLDTRLLVLGCPLSALGDQAGVLDSAGLAATAIELKGMALARAIDRGYAAIVNVDQDTVDIVIVSEGVPRMMRTLVFPGDERDQPPGRYVAQALELTMSFYESRHSDHPLPGDVPIFLVGTGSWDPSIASELQDNFDNPLEDLDPPLEVPPHFPRRDYAVNLGLALRESQAGSGDQNGRGVLPLNINLAPPKQSRLRISKELATALTGIAVGLVLVYLVFGQVAAASDETQQLRDRFAPIENSVKTRRVELSRIAEMETAISEFEELTAPWGRITQIRDYLQQTVPPDITLNSLSVLPDKVEVSLTAERVDQAIDFVEVLRAAGWQVSYPRPTLVIVASINPALLQSE